MKSYLFVFGLVVIAGVAGCGSSVSNGGPGSGGAPSGSDFAPGSPAAPGGGAGRESGAATGNGNDAGAGLAGTLTAGAWDDNLNFGFYGGYAASQSSLADRPRTVHADRMVISVVDENGAAVAGAAVAVTADQTLALSSFTAADGNVLFFPGWANVTAGAPVDVSVSIGGNTAHAKAIAGDAKLTVTLAGGGAAPVAAMDVAFVIDTTGSMGDEIRYLQDEFETIATTLRARFPAVSQRWALVVYRDVGMGDQYVTRHFDFTGDVAAFRATLGQQSAAGGGDYPESPELGLADAAGFAWRDGATARLLFWVADAPHHAGHQDALLDSFDRLHRKSVHIYPVSASGTDELLEYSMRAAAELTGGRYLFLTNDSGVGDNHKTPSIPCYYVTRLNGAMIRMVTAELTGHIVEPAADDVIRAAGSPTHNACTVDGKTLELL